MSSKRFLVIAPSWVGDLVMSQVVYRGIKQQHPEAQIDLFAPGYCKAIAQCMPELSEVITNPMRHGEFALRKRWNEGAMLRGSYDHAIVLPNSWKSAWVPYAARIKQRTGWLGEMRFGLLNDYRKLDRQQYPRMVDQYWALAFPKDEAPKQILYPKLEVPEALMADTQSRYPEAQGAIALCPGAAFGDAKKWPVEHYAAVANHYLTEGYKVALLGGPKDMDDLTHIKSLTDEQCLLYGGDVGLDEKVALISMMAGVVSNDSGLMHVASALEKPVVVLYGSTTDKFTPPLTQHSQALYRDDLSCRPCFKKTCPLKGSEHRQCLTSISPERVVDVLTTLMKEEDA